jgi:hypothetical protein
MSVDRTPPLAEIIGQWTTPRPSRLDALLKTDPTEAFREKQAECDIYREMALTSIAAHSRTTDKLEAVNRQMVIEREDKARVIAEKDTLTATVEALERMLTQRDAELVRLQAAK